MPNLGDFLGHILSEVTMARVQADLEAVTLATYYHAATPPVERTDGDGGANGNGTAALRAKLLRAMPVPRFRMPNVEITVPVCVSDMEEPESFPASRERQLDAEEAGKLFIKTMTDDLASAQIVLNAQQLGRVKRAITARVTALKTSPHAESLVEMATEFSNAANREIARLGLTEQAKMKAASLAEQFRKSSSLAFQRASSPPRLRVQVLTSEMADKPQGTLAYMKLTLTEEAYEWTTVPKPDGTLEDRLVRE